MFTQTDAMDVRARGFQTLCLCGLLVVALCELSPEISSDAASSLGTPYGAGPEQAEQAAGPAGDLLFLVPEQDMEGLAAHARARRSSMVFRPLFASREREAERMKRQEASRRYWENEQRRQQARQGYQGYQRYQG